jgi:hypothetical protein
MSSGSSGVRFRTSGAAAARADAGAITPTVGKQTLVEQLVADVPAAAAPVQRQLAANPDAANLAPDRVREIAGAGIRGAGRALPHLGTIQRLFGRHDVTGVRTHDDEAAAASAGAIGATAYATGNDVAFAGAPDLHTAAHEAAHVVQQRGGVQLNAAVGQAGDDHERHADQVADAVVQGRSAEPLFDRYAAPGPDPAADAVQRIIRKPSGEPYKTFGAVKGQLTVRKIQLSGSELLALKDIFDRDDLRLSLEQACERVRRGDGGGDGDLSDDGDDRDRGNTTRSRPGRAKRRHSDDESETPKISETKRHNEKPPRRDRNDKRPRKLDESRDDSEQSEIEDKETRQPRNEKQGKPPISMDLSDGEHSDSDAIGAMTIAEAVLAALRDTGITDRGILCLLVDPAIESLKDLLRYEKTAPTTVDEGSVDDPVELIDGERVGWVAYTSCYSTAGALLDKLSTGASRKMTGTERREIRKLDVNDARQVIAKTLHGLLAAISNVGDGREMFRIHYGIHGFSIVIRDQRAELLESFAGTTGHSFLKGLEDHPTYPIPTICALLTDMAGSNESKRIAAQETLFGGGILDDENIWPNVELLWNCGQLISDPEIVEFFRTMIQSRAKLLGHGKK